MSGVVLSAYEDAWDNTIFKFPVKLQCSDATTDKKAYW